MTFPATTAPAVEKRVDSVYPCPVPPPASRALTPPVAIAAIIALAAPLFFLGIGAHALSDPDEPYYAVPALEMLKSGTWQVPVFRGQPWFDKPILFYWMVLAAYKCLGVSEAAARVGSALAGLSGALVVFAFGRRMGLSSRGAMAAALILITTLGYALAARSAVTDMTLTVTVAAGMLAAARYLATGSLLAAACAGAAFGLAALTKGPVGLLIPAVALLVYGLATRRADLARPAALGAAVAGFLLTAAPWYLYMAAAYPDLLLTTFLGKGNLGRFVTPEHVTFHFYYVVVLAVGLLPWSGGLPAALLRAAGPAARTAAREPRRHPGALFALCWFGSVLLIFSIAASKLPSYVLPAFPPAALLLAAFWESETSSGRSRRPGGAAIVSLAIGTAIAMAGTLGVVQVTRDHAWDAVTGAGAVVAAVFVAGSLIVWLPVARRAMGWLLVTQCATSAVALAIFLIIAMPRFEPYDSTRPLVKGLDARGLTGEVVAAYKVPDVSLDYYLGRSLSRAWRMREVRNIAGREPGRIWIVRTEDLDALRSDASLVLDEVQQGPRRSAVRLSPAATPPRGDP